VSMIDLHLSTRPTVADCLGTVGETNYFWGGGSIIDTLSIRVIDDHKWPWQTGSERTNYSADLHTYARTVWPTAIKFGTWTPWGSRDMLSGGQPCTYYASPPSTFNFGIAYLRPRRL